MGKATPEDIKRYNAICKRAEDLLARLTASNAAVRSCNAGASLATAEDHMSITVTFKNHNNVSVNKNVSVENAWSGQGITSITKGTETIGNATEWVINYGANKSCKFNLEAGDEGRSGSTDSALTFYYKNGGKKFEYTMTGISVSGNVVSSSVSGVNFGATGISVSVTGLSMTARLLYVTYDTLDSTVNFKEYKSHVVEADAKGVQNTLKVSESVGEGSEQDKTMVENELETSKVESGVQNLAIGPRVETKTVLGWVSNQ